MMDRNWMRFEQSGRVADYLEYLRQSGDHFTWGSEDGCDREEGTDGAELHSYRHGAHFHADRGI